ncbi:MAG: MmcQ/YjbR family DNA-binding protein [bacterium]|nr:MmcQ/YjbR family DNA-binding protein [bacterium]
MPQPLRTTILSYALTFPESHEDHPWGETVVKLPESLDEALAQPFAEPTGYGLGKSGWVTLKIAAKDRVPVARPKGWGEESYRAVAPKKLIAQLDD